MDKISVIVPVYKVEAYLEKCVESILAQTYENYEIILVDDGSPDRCPFICDEYEKRYRNIKVIHQENGGLSAARNAGIEWVLHNSDSKWITFVDSDDWVHVKYLELMIGTAKRYKKSIASCMFSYVHNRENCVDELQPKIKIRKTIDVYKDVDYDSNSACGRLYKKELWTNLRFPVGKLHEDRFTTYKLLFLFEEIAVVDNPMYFYFMNYDGICRSQWNYRKLDNIQAIEEQLQYFEENNLIEAWKYTECEYIKMLIREMKNVVEYNKKDKRTYKSLQNKLRMQLMKYSKVLGYSFKQDINTYKYAWPILAKCYRRICSMLKIL